MSEGDTRPEPKWADSWDEATAGLAYEAARGTRETMSKWADSLDSKLVAVLGGGAVLLTVVPSLQPPSPHTLSLLFWCLAIVCWLFSVGFGVYGYHPKPLRVGPSPRALLGEDWLRLPAYQFHLYQLSVLAATYDHNFTTVERKGWALGRALLLTGAEVVSLAFSLGLK